MRQRNSAPLAVRLSSVLFILEHSVWVLAATARTEYVFEVLGEDHLTLKQERGKYLPTVAVGGSYSYTNLMRNDLGMGESNKRTALMYAMVSVPLTDWWGGSYAMRRKKNAVRSAELDRQEASQLLIVRMQSAYVNLCTAFDQVNVSRKSVEQSAENLRLEQDFYQAGTSTMSDLLKAQSSYQQAQDDFVDAWTDYQLKKLVYLQATGR